MNAFRLRYAARLIHAGGIVAYPTEAVYGLGCDPNNEQALERLLALKRRPWYKGLILLAASVAQLEPYVDFDALTPERRAAVLAAWPGPVTWLLPARPGVSPRVRGQHPKVAARVTAHPLAAALCHAVGGPIVSTSANRSGRRPARSALATRLVFGMALDGVVSGAIGSLQRPTEIRDAATGGVIRLG